MRRGRGTGRKCEAILESGKPCTAWALRESINNEEDFPDGPRCRIHAMTAGEVSAAARRAAAASATVRKGDVEAAPRLSGLDPGVRLAELLPIIREALQATHPWTHEADWPVRLAAVGTLLSSFPREYRRSPEDCAELIRRAIPAEIRPELEDAQSVYTALRASWDEIDGVRWSDLVGLWTAPYPAFMVAPWENARKIQGRRPKPIPPDCAPVMKLEDGRVALKQEGRLPTIIPSEEPAEESWPAILDTADVVAW